MSAGPAGVSPGGVMLDGTPMPTPEQVVARLEEFRARRGYVNPQQGPLAAALPSVADGYRVLYKSLVLDEKYLEPLEKEFVWLSLLCVAGEMGAHHLKLFFEHGGTDAQAAAAFRIAGWVRGTSAYEFVGGHWQHLFPGVDATSAYREGFESLVAGFDGVPLAWCCLALLSAQSGWKSKWGVEAALLQCYGCGVPEAKMAEAMSVAMWPCGANCFHDAAGVWLDLVRSGRVPASPAFQAWASLPSQDGLELHPQGGHV